MSEPTPAEPYPTSPYPAYQPQNPVPGYPVGPVEPPKKKSKLWLWLTLGAVALVLCCGGIGVAGFIAYNAAEDEVNALPSTGTSTPAAETTTAAPQTGGDVRLATPDKLAGYPKLTDKAFQDLLSATTEQVKESTNGLSTEVVSGLYGDPAQQQMRIFVAAKAKIPQPQAFLTGMIVGLKSSMNGADFSEVDAGPLGGTAQCGDAEQQGIDVAICMWVDGDSYGMVFFFFEKTSKIKAAFLQARSQIEIRS